MINRSALDFSLYKHGILVMLFTCIIGILPKTVYAQGGSNFSIFGFGDIRESIGALYEGMANTAIAMPSDHGINTVNPAMWSFVRTTRLQTGFMFRQHQNTTSDGLISKQNNGMYTGINALFAIDSTLGAAISIGYNPVTTVNIFTQLRDSLVYAGGTQYRTTDYNGSGGISSLYLGGSIRPVEHVTVGIAAHHYFGNISTRLTTVFDDFGTFAQSFNETTDRFSGLLWQVGATYTGINNVTLGATFSLPQTMSMTRSQRYYAAILTASQVFDTTLVNAPVNPNFATTLGIGASYNGGRYTIGADFLSRDFSATTYRNAGVAQFLRSTRYSVGAQYRGATDFNAHWFERLGYTGGFGIHQQYISVRNAPLSEIYGSIGTQVPLTSRARVDLSLTFGTRETSNTNILRESFGRLMVTLSVGDIWFQPFSRE
jgi:hypothetical protein